MFRSRIRRHDHIGVHVQPLPGQHRKVGHIHHTVAIEIILPGSTIPTAKADIVNPQSPRAARLRRPRDAHPNAEFCDCC
jgi:hypothetical protein